MGMFFNKIVLPTKDTLGLLHLKGYRGGGGKTFLKMQGVREGLSDNYVMGEGGSEKKICKGGWGVLSGIFILKIEAKTIKKRKEGGPTHNCVMREGGGFNRKI